MDINPKPFTFEEDFNIIPMRQGSFMIEQGLNFSQAYSNLDEVVTFLIAEKVKFEQSIPTTSQGSYDGGYADYKAKPLYPNDYEPFDKTGLPKKDEE